LVWLGRYEAASAAEQLVLVIAGQEGQLYRIEQSTDLNGWKVFRLVEGLAKPAEVSVPAAPAGGTRFYRTVTP